MMKMGGGGIGRKGGIGLTSKQVSADELHKKSEDLKERQKRAAEQVKAEEAAALAAANPPAEDPPPEVAPATDEASASSDASEPVAEAKPVTEASPDSPPDAQPDAPAGTLDLAGLIAQLGQLRAELRTRATEPEHDESVAAVGRAERALKKAQDELKTAGQWALDAAQELSLGAVSAVLSTLV